ncbi:hypothetical protein HAX54_044506, partial [Datura stramonium]|nr:hypothetical protein [Datura stramonium]
TELDVEEVLLVAMGQGTTRHMTQRIVRKPVGHMRTWENAEVLDGVRHQVVTTKACNELSSRLTTRH